MAEPLAKSRHRKVYVRLWADAKFRALSKPQPNGQSLWFYLLTGPHTTSIPGLFMAGEASLAEGIGWPLKGFREAFREAHAQGMVEADFEARVVWLPKAILYNQPESHNVIKSWRTYWDEIPECALKAKAWQALKAFLEGIGEGWSQAFTRACANPSLNQEQEQEQEQEQDTPKSPRGTLDEFADSFARFWEVFPPGRKQSKAVAAKAFQAAIKRASAETIIAAAAEYAASPVGRGEYVKGPAPWLNQDCWNDDRAAWQRSSSKSLPFVVDSCGDEA